MTTPILLNTQTAFRAETRRDVTRADIPANDDHRDAAPGAFSRRELRDLVLHWMG